MAEAKASTRRRVKFSIDAPEAQNVALMGDFNQWDETRHPMKRLGNGKWEKTLTLPAGHYQYKFLVDGKWRRDPGNEKLCPNCFGTLNNIVSID